MVDENSRKLSSLVAFLMANASHMLLLKNLAIVHNCFSEFLNFWAQAFVEIGKFLVEFLNCLQPMILHDLLCDALARPEKN